ncbi:polyprenyl synthetase family protein [Vallitalea pronyensis]|uniref:Polyprenyl synthetase family protein n=1 Tax=Vallitalea pronyensis TaxID=1348613 RepID=A0A8J8MK23_9FIRM|nr:polyprenyl synthetase family protein [Vallitalea pronyensis]QUI23267.1 polyprenyl synthetase family protein [Vallitalea pronyensis]
MSYWEHYPALQNELRYVEDYMRQKVVSKKKILTDISLDLIDAGGKRLRPAFLILAAKCGKKYNPDVIIPLAAALELIHTATLVHDDIIDESKFRRGKESIQQKWGKDMAVYVGDYLLSKSFCILSDRTSIDRLQYISRTVKAICEGEISQYEDRYKKITTYDYIKRIHRKTALLFALSLSAGASESRCSKKIGRALVHYGIHYGVAFQIYDDLLDYTSEEKKIGKPIGNDVRQGYYTLPILLACKDNHYGPMINAILDLREDITKQQLDDLFNMVKKTDAINQTKQLSNRYIQKAASRLDVLSGKQDIANTLQAMLNKLQ